LIHIEQLDPVRITELAHDIFELMKTRSKDGGDRLHAIAAYVLVGEQLLMMYAKSLGSTDEARDFLSSIAIQVREQFRVRLEEFNQH
jgi:hypothetical protein